MKKNKRPGKPNPAKAAGEPPDRRPEGNVPDRSLPTPQDGDYPTNAWFRLARNRVLKWFEKNQRKLPWRSLSSTYHVWISEVMLQQTQVQTVIDYFNRFVQRFPTVEALAAAPEPDVLAHWEGLGYYRRARNLHAAAKQIVDSCGGKFPETYAELIRLPGIGRYTAGAILSIACDQRLPILEGNTYRLFSRLLGMTTNPREKNAEKLLWQFAEDLLPGKKSNARPGQLNQGLMELGSEICHVRNPECSCCPLQSLCKAHQLGLENEIPQTGSATRYEEKRQVLLILEDHQSRALVRQRRADEWWSGLWDFVRIDLPSPSNPAHRKTTEPDPVERELQAECGIPVRLPGQPAFVLKHAVTRYRIQLDCYHIRWKTRPADNSYVFLPLESIADLPLNVTARKALNQVLSAASASRAQS